ncbi:MAG: cytochrome b/b6 domain-containing protein [Pseudomonadota bacterium]
MALANTDILYGGVAKTFHWLTALLILTAIPLGVVANQLPFETDAELARKALVFSIHKTVGIAAFFVALARILWALTQRKPCALHPERRAETWLAETVHWLLYASLVLVPLSGWLHHAATTGFAPIWWPFGQSLPFVPKSEGVAHFFAAWHFVFTKVLAVSVLLHIAGALKHVVIDRDDTLRRMWFGRNEIDVTVTPHNHRPIYIAGALYAVAIALGTVLGWPSAKTAVASDLGAVASEWTVREGTIGISVLQLGSAVDGSFADWTAAISFDPDQVGDTKGEVDVTIAIGTLTLGSVSSQAMGPDFFAVEMFPTATFAGPILETETGFVVEGSLTIKDNSTPVTLPFTIDIADNVATVQGAITLDRRNYEIGTATYADESSLGFPVDVSIALTAQKE